MLNITEYDVQRLQGSGGEPFTRFVNDLIRAQAYVGGLPDADIKTNVQTTIRDGGVDTEVRAAISNDPTGWFRQPTAWQYKSSLGAATSPDEEIVEGRYAAQLIAQGYAYRLCICDSLTPEKTRKLRESFGARIQQINNDAPNAEVLGASDLAVWANKFPALVLRHFRGDHMGQFLSLESWRGNVTALTPVFVPVPAWADIAAWVEQHVDLSRDVPEAVLPLHGEAGVGKTRLVFEALAALERASTLVVYTADDETALNMAHYWARDGVSTAILVADECDVQARLKLGNALSGARNRVRVIAIGNTAERAPVLSPQSKLDKMPQELVEEVLARNFSHVPRERRLHYAGLARGYIRYAVQLCRSDADIAATGHVDGVLPNVETDLCARLPEEELRVLEATALLTRVGIKGDVANELRQLCDLVGIDERLFRELADKLHDSTGFMARGGRFYYVTPELVAQTAFEMAWRRWAKDPGELLGRIHASILRQFLDRVARSASEQVRRAVGGFFAEWAGQVQPGQLSDAQTTDWLGGLVDADPATYLPVLRHLVERASEEDLLAVTGESIHGRWGPRRSLVWLAERIAAFPEYFADAEAMLLRLALAESEPRIANNATAIWQQLFRIVLSGTAVPFRDRLTLLEERIHSADGRTFSLALDALGGMFSRYAYRISGPFVVAGRIRPDEWFPRIQGEGRECLDAAVDALRRASTDSRPEVRQKARDVALDNLFDLLLYGYLGALKDMLPMASLSDATRVRLLSEVQRFLRVSAEAPGAHVPQAYVQDVEAWLAALKPSGLHGRLVTAVGVEPWDHFRPGHEDTWRAELRGLCLECVSQPDLLETELGWLCSGEAKSAVVFGEELAKVDEEAALLNLVLDSVSRYGSAELARGYVLGTPKTDASRVRRINAAIDSIEHDDPKLAYGLFMAGRESTRAVARALKLVDEGALAAEYLGGFAYGEARKALSIKDVQGIVERLLRAVDHGDVSACRTAMTFVGFRLHQEREEAGEKMSEHPPLRSLLWRLLEATVSDGGGETYHWSQILESLAGKDPDRAAALAVLGMTSQQHLHEDYCEKLLISLAREHAETVVRQLGAVMLDADKGRLFQIRVYRELLASLPSDVVSSWVNAHGVEAARRLARHLPLPFVDSDGSAVVPPLTESVLVRFEADDQTFREFCAGAHSLQWYSGDIAAEYEREGKVAEHFLNHPMRRISEWARYEYQECQRQARQWREREEEDVG